MNVYYIHQRSVDKEMGNIIAQVIISFFINTESSTQEIEPYHGPDMTCNTPEMWQYHAERSKYAQIEEQQLSWDSSSENEIDDVRWRGWSARMTLWVKKRRLDRNKRNVEHKSRSWNRGDKGSWKLGVLYSVFSNMCSKRRAHVIKNT